MKNILIVDGNSIINRAFYGIRALQNSSGRYTNAIYGMINIISKQLEALKPEYSAVAFDVHHPTFRHEMYPEYKQGRHPTPPELLEQFAPAKEVLRAMGMKVLELPGWEADDIQGTVSRMAEGDPGTHAYILSGDRDLLQLITPSTTVLLATTGETVTYNESQFVEKYGVPPLKLIDLKALMGDSSDNIPGVPGVGEKTAGKLISLFGSLDGLYSFIDGECEGTDECKKAVTASLRAKLEGGKDKAYMSYDLATIRTDAPIGCDKEALRYTGVDNDELYRLCIELELGSVIKKFGLKKPRQTATAYTDKAAEESQGMDCLGDGDTDDLFAILNAKINENEQNPSSEMANVIDISAEELLSRHNSRLAVVCKDSELKVSAGADECMRLRLDDPKLHMLFDGNREIICYDAKAMYHLLKKQGTEVCCVPKDVMLQGYILRGGDGSVALSALALSVLGESIDEASPSPELLCRLYDSINERLTPDQRSLAENVEYPLAMLLAEMEQTGFKINRKGLDEYGRLLHDASEQLTERIYMMAGHPFNINSTKQLSSVLFEEIGLKPQKKTKSGYSTDVESLTMLRFAHPIIEDILAYRQITKLYSTYVVGLLGCADEQDRVHTDFKQALTATGRLSSAEPNLQNIPVRTELGRRIRGYFIPEEGSVLVDADYSQIELRLLAVLSGDENMQRAFLDGKDIHRSTAALVFGIPEESVTDELRKRAKAVNFGIVYGIGAHSLSIDLGCTRKQAQDYIDAYMASFPSIGKYLNDTIEAAAEAGYTTTMLGRRRMIPELKDTKASVRAFGKRVAMNSPIQGTAADIMKVAMLRVWKALREQIPDARIVMQVHDELIVEVPEEQGETTRELLRREMEAAASLSVPLCAEGSVGKNWLQAK